jgi:hypothetical protein
MGDDQIDFDNDVGSTRPKMWKHFKQVFDTIYYIDRLATRFEQLARGRIQYVGNQPGLVLAVAMHRFAALEAADQTDAAKAFWNWAERLKLDPAAPLPTTDPPRGGGRATVRVGSRIVDLRDGYTQYSAIVELVRPECVIARFDPETVGPQTFAARYDEFGVEPIDPALPDVTGGRS